VPSRDSRVPFSGRVRPTLVLTIAALVLSGAEAVLMAGPATAAPTPPGAARVVSRPDQVSAVAAARAQKSRVKVDGAGSPSEETYANPEFGGIHSGRGLEGRCRNVCSPI
jgi:hypothetical protein